MDILAMVRRTSTRISADFGIARGIIVFCVALLQVAGVLRPGIVYSQDWLWPISRSQLAAALRLNSVPWSSNGVGSAAIAPLKHPLFDVWALFNAISGPHWTLVVSLFLTFAMLGLGVSSCLSRFWGARSWDGTLIAVAAQVGIPIFNKFVAGHLYYLIALACFVWQLRALGGGSRRPIVAFLAACLFAALAIIQIQIFVIAAVLLLVAAFLKREVPLGIRFLGVFLVFIQLAPLIIAAVDRDAVEAFQRFAPELSWELNNSAPLPAGVLLLGYAPHYASRALAAGAGEPIGAGLLILFAAFALLAAWVRRHDRLALALTAGWLLGTMLVVGLYGPLAPLLKAMFAHVPAFAVFRELYHFAGPAWICEVLLIGAMPWRIGKRVSSAAASAALLVWGLMWVMPAYSGQLTSIAVPASLPRNLASVEASPGDGRVLLWPAEWPVGPSGMAGNGDDPVAYPLGDHPAANEFRLSGPLEVGAAFVRGDNGRMAQRWFAAAGVSAVVDEPWLKEYLSYRAPPLTRVPVWLRTMLERSRGEGAPPKLRPTCLLCAYRSLDVVSNAQAWSAQGEDAFLLSDDLNRTSGCTIQLPFDEAPDPGVGWKRLANWSWIDPRLAMLQSGLMTWSSKALRLSGCHNRPYAVTLLALHGTVYVDGRMLRGAIGNPRTIALAAGGHSISVRDGLLAVGNRMSMLGGSSQRLGGRSVPARSALRFSWRNGVGTGWIAHGTKWVVLKMSFSPLWRLKVTEGSVLRHVVASNYANAWKVRVGARGSALRVWYAPWPKTMLVSGLAEACWWIGLVLALFYAVRRPSRAVA